MCDDSESHKWVCEYCTYENFPSALKCTMCRGPKPLLATEDIFKLSKTQDISAEKDAKSKREDNVWYCDECKYTNNCSSAECSKCRIPRNNNDSLLKKFGALSVGENEVVVGNEQKMSLPKKWMCSVCTYENWPKATKCVMCSQLRSKSPSLSEAEHEAIANTRNIEDSRLKQKKRTGLSMINNREMEKRIRSNRKLQKKIDWPWLNACVAVLKGDLGTVLAYLKAGGDISRQLTPQEVSLINGHSAFEAGHTLVHIAIKFKREDILAALLSTVESGSSSGMKRVPSYVAPDIAADIRRYFASIMRQKKSNFPCPFVNEHTTFFLPAEIDGFPATVQQQLFDEILDKDVQQQLEAHNPPVINWSDDGSRLFALWNRTAGDCLLDSIMQATWGVFDRDGVLRSALADALTGSMHMFYSRWREFESAQASTLAFTLEESQWQEDWASLVSLAARPGSSLEQIHIFALAHILRRPIIVYGVKNVKGFRGEDIGYAKFEGVYLPLLWERSFCIKTPLALGYTRGHFSALVPSEGDATPVDRSRRTDTQLCVAFLPLVDYKHDLLPLHFVSQSELGQEDLLLRQWMDVFVTDSGMLVAQQELHMKPLLVAQMVEEWLNFYRRLVQTSVAPFSRAGFTQYCCSSESDSDHE